MIVCLFFLGFDTGPKDVKQRVNPEEVHEEAIEQLVAVRQPLLNIHKVAVLVSSKELGESVGGVEEDSEQ